MDFNEENFNKLKGVVDTLAIEIKDDTDDFSGDFTKGFDTKFVLKSEAKDDEDIINAVFGKTASVIEQGIKKQAKAIGVEFEDGLFKDKKVTEVVDLVFAKTSEHFATQMTDLKKSSNKTDDKKLIDLQSKYDTLSGEHSQRKDDLEGLVKDIEVEKAGREDDKKKFTSEFEFKVAYGKTKFIDDMTELQHKGFSGILKDKYDFKLNDEGVTTPYTKTDGKMAIHPTKKGVYLSMQEVIEQEAKTQGVIKNNNGSGKAPTNLNAQVQGAGAGDSKPVRKVAQRLNALK